MTKIINTALCNICPFVRYVRTMDVSYNEYPVLTVAYDCRLFYVTKGTGIMVLGGETYEVQRGDLLFWQPGIPYRMDTHGEKTLQFLAVNFDLTQSNNHRVYPFPPVRLEELRRESILERLVFSDIPRFNEQVYVQGMHQVEDTLHDMVLENQSKRTYCFERMSGMMVCVMSSIARRLALGQVEPQNSEHKIEQVIDYIRLHYAEDITNESMGRMFNYHPNYLNKLMVLYTDHSLHQYLLSYRISKAIDLIAGTNMDLAAVCESVGFQDYCHFSKLFKQKTGSSPRDYRGARS
ncbi:MAG TPA: AraC family transcriptional regulator [Feifaniaceae bacterium]|nr:AraC family transcriptional regulator [Feifaniaceae bacterium]